MENTSAGVRPNMPKVTIIVPARDEEANIERCLRSIVMQRGVSFEVLVVDDASTDRTREIAETFTKASECPFLASNKSLASVRVLSARPLAEGWAGKSNACATAAEVASGEWLLFTDADTEHMEGSLATAVAEAEEHEAAMLSYSPEQVLTGASQKALMPVIFAELAREFKPSQVNDARSPSATANGQYMMIRRSVYAQAGGFGAVSGSLLEDVALAKRVKALPAKIRFRLGAGLVRTRMYRDWADMQAGWTKNLALLFPRTQALAIKRLVEFFLLVLLPVFATLSAVARHEMIALVEAVFAFGMWTEFILRIRRAHAGFVPTVLAVAGLPLFSALLLRSAAAHARGAVTWKGRTYAGSVTSGVPAQSNAQEAAKSAPAR